MKSRILQVAAIGLAGVVLLAVSGNAAHALEIKRARLKSGAVLLVSEQHQLPMVSIAIAFDAGSRRDPVGKEGLAELTAASLEQGTKQLSAADFNQKIDFMGSSLSIGADRDYAYASMTSLKKYETETLHLLSQALENPGLRDSDILRKRGELVASIETHEQEPGYAASVAFTRMLFDNGPYGHPTEGFVNSVRKLTPEDVRDFYRRYYRMGSAVIAVAGDVDFNTIRARIEHELTNLQGRVPAQPEPALPHIGPGIHAKLIDRNVAQANLILGSPGIARANADYYRIQVMNYILGGGGFSSRLMKVVRSKGGLAYSIDSTFSAGKFPGAFAIILQTKNQSAQEALKLIVQQLRQIREQTVSDAELEAAKKFLIGSFPLRLDRQSQIVSFMLQVELYNLGLDYAERYPRLIGEVTKQDVKQVAQKYLHPDALDLVAVANQSVAGINPTMLVTSPPSRTP
jgi:zinc protease